MRAGSVYRGAATQMRADGGFRGQLNQAKRQAVAAAAGAWRCAYEARHGARVQGALGSAECGGTWPHPHAASLSRWVNPLGGAFALRSIHPSRPGRLDMVTRAQRNPSKVSDVERQLQGRSLAVKRVKLWHCRLFWRVHASVVPERI